MKESIQLQYAAATSDGKWPSDQDCPEFEIMAKKFMKKCHAVSCAVMRLFAIGLELEDEDWFAKVHDISDRGSMSTLRCILYHDTLGNPTPTGHWRAGYSPTSEYILI
jgi:isopenicillin N synthase-like dioxygenase